MKLQLDFNVKPSFKKISLHDSIYLIGSCFSQSLATKMTQAKMKCIANPFGTLYNPHSIFKVLSGKINHDSTVVCEDVHYHWDAHGEISALNLKDLNELTKQKMQESSEFIQKTQWLFVTLGTAWVYRHKKTGEVVANCHKVNEDQFYKEILSIEEIADSFRRFKKDLANTNPYINLVVTVSPVRHIKEGIIENNRSKARLLEAVHDMVDRFENVIYFPAYEIVIDELRDYRFYKSDLVHPNDQALDYVWEKFTEAYFDDEALAFLKKWKKINASISHQPFQPKSKAHQKFLKATLLELEEMNKKMDFTKEINLLRSQLI